MRNKAETVFQEEEQKSKKCKIGEIIFNKAKTFENTHT